jgi:hypothetical protein
MATIAVWDKPEQWEQDAYQLWTATGRAELKPTKQAALHQ